MVVGGYPLLHPFRDVGDVLPRIEGVFRGYEYGRRSGTSGVAVGAPVHLESQPTRWLVGRWCGAVESTTSCGGTI